MGSEEKSTAGRIVEFSMAKSRVCEMAGDTQLINVPVNPRIDIDTITADDPNPKFVNVEVLRAGVSGNNRRYNNGTVAEVCEMVPGTQGFFGHPDPSKFGFEFREPQCIYVGSMVDHMADGLDRCIAKAYIFKTSPLREWIPKSIAAGNPMTVSINGTGDILRCGDFLDVVHMSDLQSIDWANPGTEGMETSKAMSVVREMNEGGNSNMENVSAQDIIKNATVTEFKAFNPTGYDAIVKGITVTELQAVNPQLVETIKESAKITEMSITRDGKEEKVKLSDVQGIISGMEQKITELQGDAQKSKLEAYKTQKIAEMVDEDHREAFMKRVTGNTEAEIDASITEQIGFIREMGGTINAPKNTREQNGGQPDMKASIRALFGVKEDK